ncbi:MAG: hypothetical protein DRH56_03050 [Deltaproteobacteria bacterium]|nr:MAG: hypothetical protein DRH56_03050 [Deltaproteobacteria bacterium]
MRPRLWLYFLRQALVNIMNNRVFHAIGMGTMVVCLLIFGTFLVLFVNLNAWLQGWGHTLSMSVYLEDGIGEPGRKRVEAFLRKLPGAEIRRYISKEGAMRDLRHTLGPQAALLEGLSVNPLPASFELIFRNSPGKEKVDSGKLKERIKTIPGVSDVEYSEEWVKRFQGILGVVRLAGFFIGGLLALGILFIVTNTIKLTIYSRRDEIEILKLVGATDGFVKAPFLLEGMIQGVLSGTTALLLLFFGYFLLCGKKIHLMGLALPGFVFIPQEYVFSILIMSVALGLAGSFIAVGRFFDL